MRAEELFFRNALTPVRSFKREAMPPHVTLLEREAPLTLERSERSSNPNRFERYPALVFRAPTLETRDAPFFSPLKQAVRASIYPGAEKP